MTIRELMRAFAPHPLVALEARHDASHALLLWLLHAALRAHARDSTRIELAISLLSETGPSHAQGLSNTTLSSLTHVFASAGLSKPDAAADLVRRLTHTLVDHGDNPLARWCAEATDLEELGSRLGSLAPGFGRAATLRFLRPLRDDWSLLDGLPVSREAGTAAAHLGWLEADADPDSAVGTLRQIVRAAPDPPAFRDFEFALEQLGRVACTRSRARHCPLAARCPRNDSDPARVVASAPASE